MTFSSLRDFIVFLEKKGELIRIQEPVKVHLEITEIHQRVIKNKGPALLFEKPIKDDGTISDIPVLVNLYGTVDRIALGLNIKSDEFKDLGLTLAELRQPSPPKSIKDAPRIWDMAKKALSMRSKIVKSAPVQEIIIQEDHVDLTMLPIQTCWPNEPAPLITWPLVVSEGPFPNDNECDNANLGIYRMQLCGKNKTIMRWLKHRGGAQHHQRWQENKKENLPVSIVLGADPYVTIAAVAPVPDNLSEYKFAGLLKKKPIELVKCITNHLYVPATAEIVIEGEVSLKEYKEEGPYGDHTGYYNNVELFPVFTAKCITMRKNPLYLSTFTARPPDEPSVLGEALNDVFVPLIQKQFPEIVDFWLPPEACSYRMAVISIKKSYPGHAKRIMMGAWSYLRQFMYTKFIIIVDDDIDVRKWDDVIWALVTRSDPKRDSVIIENTPIDYLDFASPVSSLGSKIGIDATNKIIPETDREWGEVMEMDEDVKNHIDKIWHKLGLTSF